METKEIEEKVLIALDEIRPFLASDGGDISLVGIETVSYTHLTLPTNREV